MKKNIVNREVFGTKVSVDFDEHVIRVGEEVVYNKVDLSDKIFDAYQQFFAGYTQYQNLKQEYQKAWKLYELRELSGSKLDQILDQMKEIEALNYHSHVHFLFELADRLVARYTLQIKSYLQNHQTVQA